MTQKTDLEKAEYFRLLELMAVISEEWGECIKELNDYNWKEEKRTIKTLENSILELNQMYSPMYELQGLLEVMITRKKNSETLNDV